MLLLLACGAPPLSSLGTGTGTAKAPSGEYCDGEDNDGDGTVDEDCGTCDMLRTRVRSWWQDAECVVEGGGTGRSLYPISVGTTNNYYTWDTLGSFLAAPVVTDKGRLGQQIAVAKLNSKAFGIGAIPYHDWDADGDLETVDELLALADTIFSGFDATAQVDMFNVVVALNSEGNALPSWIDQHCARDAEYCDGLDNDGNGTVDDNCGCVEVCDGYDNDFDGATDESGADNDRDGFDCDDCDDTRARTYPGAYDVPENAIDDDCDGTDPQYTYDYDEDVQPIYDAYCVGCHGPGGQSPDLSPGVSYANTVGVASTQLSSYVLVQPASTSQSYLYRKVQGNHTAVGGSGGRMPLGGPYLSFAQSGILGTWITEGAPPSCPDADGDGWECTDCDDSDPTIYPGAPETKGDEIDQNCDDADDLYTYGLEEDIQPLFTTYCTSCHGATVQQLGLRLDEGYTLSETVNVPSTQLPSMDLLEPGDHTTSYLYHKLAGSHRTVGGAGNRMPQGGPFFLAEVLEMIAFWIDEGAPANACNDADGDVWSCNDCDDGDAAVNPDAVEACDGVDNNCDGAIDDDAADATAWYADADADGSGNPADVVWACEAPGGYVATDDDCDDTNGAVNGGAPEVCNGLDDDCDGLTDDADSVTGAASWYADLDGDGFGAAPVVTACAAPGGHVANGADCDDTDPAVSPAAAEVCDGVDNDCAGGVDTGAVDATVWYQDNDGDGHGNDAVTVTSCSAPAGYASVGEDCDDENAYEHPSAPEVCGDTYDNDCSGDAIMCHLIGDYTTDDANAQLWGNTSDMLGHDIAPAGDVTGVGQDFIWIASAWTDAGGSNAGTVYLLGDAVDLHGPDPISDRYDAALGGEAANDAAGGSVDGDADIDGDGVPDVAVGATGNDRGGTNAGTAYVVFGPFSGERSLSIADAMYTGDSTSDQAATALAFLPGIDGGDGVGLAVGSVQDADGGTAAGAVWVVSSPAVGEHSLSGEAKFVGENPNDQAGVAMSRIGDFDGDGLADLLVGAHQNDAGGSNAGAAYLLLAPFSGTVDLSLADAKLTGQNAGDIAGFIVAGAGDVDADGLADAYIAAPNHDGGGTDAGAVYLVRGAFAGTRSLGTALAKFNGTGSSTQLGVGASNAGDVDGDGVEDLVAGGRGYDDGTGSVGGAWVFFQPVVGTTNVTSADVTITGDNTGDSFGDRVAGVGDADNDGFGDFLVNATLADTGGTSSGVVYIFLSPGF